MSEMVERVAKALASNMEEGFPRFTQMTWDNMSVLSRAAYRQRARVAIESMRQPSRVMVDAGDAETVDDASTVWAVMIEAAFK